LSGLTSRLLKSYDYLIALRTTGEAQKLWSRPPLVPSGGLRVAGARSDPTSAAVPAVLDLDPGADGVALGNSGAIRARLGALARRLEGTAVVSAAAEQHQDLLLITEADTSLSQDDGGPAQLILSDPVETTETQERLAGASLIRSDEEVMAPGPAPATATDPAGKATMPTPLRIVATALEGVAILVYGFRMFRR
jgi:hypothetical protein